MQKHIIMVQGFPVKLYVSHDDTTVYVFPLFGKYYRLFSDESALDFATTFLLARNTNNVISFAGYQASGEDTAIINIEAA